MKRQAGTGPGDSDLAELMSDIHDLVNRRYVENPDGIAGCTYMPARGGRVGSGHVQVLGLDRVRNQEGLPFAALPEGDQLDLLYTYIDWDSYEGKGIGAAQASRISLNVAAGKPREEWPEGVTQQQDQTSSRWLRRRRRTKHRSKPRGSSPECEGSMSERDLVPKLQDHKAWVKNPTQGRRADLRGADLRGMNLSGADLQWADLRASDLRGAILADACLRHADLRGANLSQASCLRTDFTNAKLVGANLVGTDLRGAVMQYADTTAAKFYEVRTQDNGAKQKDLIGERARPAQERESQVRQESPKQQM